MVHLLKFETRQHTPYDYSRSELISEAWVQGFSVGAIVILIIILLSNYRRHVLLHKLILLELLLAIVHGFFIFGAKPISGWVLSATAVPLNVSYNVHNVIAWLKIRPFLSRRGSRFFIGTLILVQPYWVLEMYANFAYFNGVGPNIFLVSRYLEPVARDPWWIFTTAKLFIIIKQNYEYTFLGLIKTSPRFAMMLLCMIISIVFIIADVVVTAVAGSQFGINPYWRLSMVFKCAADTMFLDDFKSVLDHIAQSAMGRVLSLPPILDSEALYSMDSGSRGAQSHLQTSPSSRPSHRSRRTVEFSVDRGSQISTAPKMEPKSSSSASRRERNVRNEGDEDCFQDEGEIEQRSRPIALSDLEAGIS